MELNEYQKLALQTAVYPAEYKNSLSGTWNEWRSRRSSR